MLSVWVVNRFAYSLKERVKVIALQRPDVRFLEAFKLSMRTDEAKPRNIKTNEGTSVISGNFSSVGIVGLVVTIKVQLPLK